MELLLFLLAGILAGFLAGLLGIGGGIIIVPTLYFLFRYHHFPPELVMHMAIGTSLMVMFFNSSFSVRAHHKNHNLLWNIFFKIAWGIVIGAIVASLIANYLPGFILHKIFIFFLLLSAVQVVFNFQPKGEHELPNRFGLILSGVVIGTLATLLGMGGSILSIPFFLFFKVKMKHAVALASACSLPVAIVGAIGFMMIGWGKSDLPAWTTGYIYWPAVIGISIGALLCSRFGAKLAIRLPGKVLRITFASFLLVIGVLMLI